jgi:hypothetical protein
MNLFQRWFSSWQWNKVTQQNSFYANILFNKDTPVLIDTDDLMRPYKDCPHLQLVINKRAEMMSNMWVRLYDKDDNEIKEHYVLTLLNKPTALQNLEEWVTQYSIYKDIFANNFIYKLKATSVSQPAALWNLPSGLMEILWTGKMFKQTDIKEIIKEYILYWNTTEEKYKTEEIIYKTENFHAECGKGLSKIFSLTLPISNIIASLKSRNIIITEKGMFGILSNQAKDNAGAIPLGKEERERVEKQLTEDKGLYSDKGHIIVTNSSLKWEAMGYPMKDMAFMEEVEDDFQTICGAYGIDRDIFPSIKGATFENKKQGLISTYQNTIQPEADDLMNTLSSELGLTEQGLQLVADYSWLPIMQNDKGSEESAEKTKIERLKILMDSGIISREAFAEMAGVDLTGKQSTTVGSDSLGKIPLALQQLALARERANTAGDLALSASLSSAMDILTAQLVTVVIPAE